MVAVGGDGKLLASRISGATREHAGTINNTITETLADAGISLNDLSAIAVCGGPGSYTGLRIGMATAKGLCYALDKPLLNDNRLTLLAYQGYMLHKGYSKYIAVLKAREKEYFITSHDQDFECIVPPQHIHEENIDSIISGNNLFLISDIHDLLADKLAGRDYYVEKSTEIALSQWVVYAFERYNCNLTVNLSSAEPFYLKQVYTHK
jgi:tRNA threonylcarbamoyladenosine biosynthesis protein TsaB